MDVTIVGKQNSITIPEGVVLCDSVGPFDEMPPDVARFYSEFKTAFMGNYISGLLGSVLILLA